MKLINSRHTEAEKIKSLNEQFRNADPYPHVVLDQFLEPEVAKELAASFPSIEALKTHWKSINEKKSESSDFSNFAPVFAQVRQTLASPEFCEWVSKVTGIKDVFITDDHMGAGLHQGGNGSFLDIHIDFNIHTSLNVHRRLNLLIYLTPEWHVEWGGALELWNANMTECKRKVFPELNRCVIFETSEVSYHGYGKVSVPEGVTRKSLFSYFYTNEREDAVPYHDTIFKARPEEGLAKKVATDVKETVKNTAKATLRKFGINK
jgi:Rps23 Pro-64 3,4-dihydroxylase Tpa1-like proline 4-hydroxylase